MQLSSQGGVIVTKFILLSKTTKIKDKIEGGGKYLRK